jgi:hypothetical protein
MRPNYTKKKLATKPSEDITIFTQILSIEKTEKNNTKQNKYFWDRNNKKNPE